MTRTDPRRGGFTLLELMVVILLIITLAALSAGAFFKVQTGQRVGATESTLRKIQLLMDNRWRQVLEDARKTVPAPVVTLAGDDKDRATSLWTYIKLKNEFPERFDEVWVTTPTPGPRPVGIPGVNLSQRAMFTTIASKPYTPTPTTQEQAAALLYATLAQTGDLEGLNQAVGTTPSGLTVFVDNWGTPITFVRWASPDEIQGEPHIRPSVVQSRSGTSYTINPLDPSAKLLGPPFTVPPAPPPNPPRPDNPLNFPRYDNPWGTVDDGSPNHLMRVAVLGVIFPGQRDPVDSSKPMQFFPNRNFAPALISAGPDKDFGNDVYGANSTDAGTDNVLSYRLRREGN